MHDLRTHLLPLMEIFGAIAELDPMAATLAGTLPKKALLATSKSSQTQSQEKNSEESHEHWTLNCEQSFLLSGQDRGTASGEDALEKHWTRTGVLKSAIPASGEVIPLTWAFRIKRNATNILTNSRQDWC